MSEPISEHQKSLPLSLFSPSLAPLFLHHALPKLTSRTSSCQTRLLSENWQHQNRKLVVYSTRLAAHYGFCLPPSAWQVAKSRRSLGAEAEGAAAETTSPSPTYLLLLLDGWRRRSDVSRSCDDGDAEDRHHSAIRTVMDGTGQHGDCARMLRLLVPGATSQNRMRSEHGQLNKSSKVQIHWRNSYEEYIRSQIIIVCIHLYGSRNLFSSKPLFIGGLTSGWTFQLEAVIT